MARLGQVRPQQAGLPTVLAGVQALSHSFACTLASRVERPPGTGTARQTRIAGPDPDVIVTPKVPAPAGTITLY